jgi:hypothetical protein
MPQLRKYSKELSLDFKANFMCVDDDYVLATELNLNQAAYAF